jgi:hypothetical protein
MARYSWFRLVALLATGGMLAMSIVAMLALGDSDVASNCLLVALVYWILAGICGIGVRLHKRKLVHPLWHASPPRLRRG